MTRIINKILAMLRKAEAFHSSSTEMKKKEAEDRGLAFFFSISICFREYLKFRGKYYYI